MDTRELLPDYLLDLLEPAEKQAVDRALKNSSELQAELEELRAVLFRIPEELTSITPPPSSWGKIQARVSPRRDWIRWVAAAAVLALLLVGAWGFNQYQTIRALQVEQTKIAEWVAIPKAHWRSFGSKDKTYGTMIWIDGDCYMVMVDPAPKGRVYQVWGRKEDDVPISLGIFGGRTFKTKYEGYKSVGVSLEPPGGSPAPTQPLGRVSTIKEKAELPKPTPLLQSKTESSAYLNELKAVLGPSGTNPYCKYS